MIVPPLSFTCNEELRISPGNDFTYMQVLTGKVDKDKYGDHNYYKRCVNEGG